MKMFQRFLALVLVACMLLSVMPLATPASAASEVVVTVGASGCDYKTITAALKAVPSLRSSSSTRVIIEIQPGNYEEQLYIDQANITLRNASANPSIALKNKGVDIDSNAVRITHYYGHGYNYYSMNSSYLYDEALLATNKSKGSASVTNPGAGSATHWNASVIIAANGFIAEDIIFENSFNQYISNKASKDGIVTNGGQKEGSTARAKLAAGSTAVQDKAYVERAAALAIKNNVSQAYFDHCKFVGRQDTLYGGKSVTAAFYDCEVYGACDYIFGPMTAVFAKCDLVFNTSDSSSDRGYITATQTASGSRGYLMYNCHVTSTTPGVDTASSNASKPGYFGRPWAENTGEAIFYYTVIDATCSKWSSQSASLIYPAGWLDTLKGESKLCGEYGTVELSGVNNSSKRESWAKGVVSGKLNDGKAISVSTFLGSWNPFSGKDMTITTDGTVVEPEETTPTNPPSGGDSGDSGNSGSTTVPAGEYVHIFQDSGKNSSFYTITGDGTSTSKGSATVNGTTYNTCFKMNSAGKIVFTAPTAGTFTMIFSTSSAGKTIDMNGTVYTIPSDGVLNMDAVAGTNTVVRKSGESFLFYMAYTSDSVSGGDTEDPETPDTVTATGSLNMSKVTVTKAYGAADPTNVDSSLLNGLVMTVTYSNGNTSRLGVNDLTISAIKTHDTMGKYIDVDYNDPVTGTKIHTYILVTIEESANTHTHSYSKKVTAPTCTAQGYTTYTCSCGDSYKADYVAAKGHSYSGGKCSVCGAKDPNASTGGEYLVRDVFFSLNDSSVNRMTSEHFQIIWGNKDESGEVNEAFVRGNLTNLEAIWAFYVNELGMKEPNTSVTNGSSQKYKINFYISNTGLGNVVMDDWAYMSVDSGGFGYMCLMPGAMRVDEPSWVLPHELAHVFTYHQGGSEPYGYYEAIANWFRDQYLGSTYYAYGNKVYGPTSDFFKPFMVNHDYYFPHILNWYDAWPILLYISENPDNINGLGMDLIHDILENQSGGGTIFAIIDQLSDVSVKDILGYMSRRLVTLDFSRQEYYQMRQAEQMTSAEIAALYTTLESKSDGYLHSPSNEAPMQGGFNFVPLNADLSKSSLSVEFVGTSNASGADWRASIVTVTRSGDTRYSSLFNSGIGTIALQGDEIAAYLVVSATPDTMQALTTYDENAVGTRYTYKIRIVENTSHTHSYSSSVTTAATCGKAGVRTYTCSCGDKYTETIPATGNHSYANGSCTVCGAKDPNYSPSTPPVVSGGYIHNFTDDGFESSFYTFAGSQVTNGKHGTYTYNFGSGTETLNHALKFDSGGSAVFTPTANGTVTIAVAAQSAGRKVVISNGSSNIGEVNIDTANKLFVLTVDVSANVTYTVKRSSGESGLYYIAYVPASSGGDVHTHSYTSSVTTAATCTTAGVRTYVCSCGNSYTESIPATGHSYTSEEIYPNCTTDGYILYTCSKCGNTYTEAGVASQGHFYENGYCTYCGAEDPNYTTEWEDAWTTEYSDWITLNSDGTVTFTVSGTVAAGNWGFLDNVRLWNEDYEEVMLTNGYFEDGTNGWTLTGLNNVYADETAKNNKTNRLALWLSNDSDVYGSASNTVNVPAGSYYFTYDIIGNSGLTCSVSKTENHTHSYSKVVTAPTCTTQGYTTYTCACGDSYKTDYVAATSHSYKATVTAPTCTAQGYTTYTCSCGDSYKADYVAAAGHSYKAVVTAPTCTAQGYTTYTCVGCGNSYKANYVGATGHSYKDGVCTVCGAADPNYVALFNLAGANVDLGNSLTMNFYVNVGDIQGTNYYIEIVKSYADGTSVTTQIPYAQWESYFGVMWMVSLEGMAAKEMADKIEVTVYTTAGVQVSNTWTDSIRDYCVRQLNNASQSAAYTLLVDMLNYGAAAQVNFGYNTGDLANSTLTAAQKNYATKNFNMGDYSNNMVVGTNFIGSSLSLETNIVLSMYFNKPAATNPLVARIRYTDHLGNLQTYTVAEADFLTLGNLYGVAVDTLVASDVCQLVTLEVYDGNKVVVYGADSMESYAVRQGGDINTALMIFTLSAYDYLH